ncbi:MAG: hypothetical protein KAS32_27220 [Candidatus Peribacteraceae bacterium]|nr:hypothetical protein [Candidatus Peribacteraceae bacterium]
MKRILWECTLDTNKKTINAKCHEFTEESIIDENITTPTGTKGIVHRCPECKEQIGLTKDLQ